MGRKDGNASEEGSTGLLVELIAAVVKAIPRDLGREAMKFWTEGEGRQRLRSFLSLLGHADYPIGRCIIELEGEAHHDKQEVFKQVLGPTTFEGAERWLHENGFTKFAANFYTLNGKNYLWHHGITRSEPAADVVYARVIFPEDMGYYRISSNELP
ncbi:MAG: hypothetical protein ACD_81C00126G0014 [uncultured bacterium]|uniref:Uncharacterized protein n=2 Tax=Candidatus Wolfeibacteriota TaxID=1752735 RepID=A0A0G1K7H5_9BACT|nr:MAG: hypothetical protein ACD_81C00126G0014 [uncultured bacterium]KKR12893.1 MAG: hypothetical protein UT41_C0001G0437 [Candidatus Wolfebacteria bacterium GW2011_GWC2_39_22]KKT43824.1 MAG: hypothetical protein UW32_C0001G0416 [Candidatus Wolfebacteria bacterium GW2011_GWE2_44_13]HBI25448.1 hypothetical protein [Candidatus Wolfebacteria bacterium]